jgi:UDP-N-acetylmuramoyl-L-alanyl-D-glutamate--2,6-diaminopimelate ligase
MTLRPMPLSDVVERLRAAGLLVEVHGPAEVELAGASQDSRTTGPGELFLAWKGIDADAHDHLADAVRAGAAAAVVERPVPEISVPQIEVSDGRLAAALAADLLFDSPSRALLMCAVTGTNGKTTTTLLARHLLQERGGAGAIGTLGVVGPEGTVRPGSEGLTTPGPVDVQRRLRTFLDEEVRSVVM